MNQLKQLTIILTLILCIDNMYAQTGPMKSQMKKSQLSATIFNTYLLNSSFISIGSNNYKVTWENAEYTGEIFIYVQFANGSKKTYKSITPKTTYSFKSRSGGISSVTVSKKTPEVLTETAVAHVVIDIFPISSSLNLTTAELSTTNYTVLNQENVGGLRLKTLNSLLDVSNFLSSYSITCSPIKKFTLRLFKTQKADMNSYNTDASSSNPLNIVVDSDKDANSTIECFSDLAEYLVLNESSSSGLKYVIVSRGGLCVSFGGNGGGTVGGTK